MNGGTPGVTIVHPVKANYTAKTWYRGQITVEENWIHVFHFFVDSFGEWRYGTVDTIKMPDRKNILWSSSPAAQGMTAALRTAFLA